ncbi:MAG: hypothetical protein HY784_05085 [Chloroflexi bacterium]|nr:hypothetical protein [Chloroflexota bacterium]
MNPLRSLADYELFIYTLAQRYQSIQRSTLVVIRRGDTIAVVRGEVEFRRGIRLPVREKLSFIRSPGKIEEYGYEVWFEDQQLYWYDSQPHPDDPTLASTHPHHKHLPPDTSVPEAKRSVNVPEAKRSGIKHNRVPAPGLSFERPNLPFLVEEIERELLRQPES